jgi:iron complex transport system substrate-binding protein
MTVNKEWVLAQNPEYIIKMIYAQYLSQNTSVRAYSETIAGIKEREGWEKISAVRNNPIYVFENNSKYGPRAYIDLMYTAKIFHPDQFRDIDPGAMLDTYARDYVWGANETLAIYPQSA